MVTAAAAASPPVAPLRAQSRVGAVDRIGLLLPKSAGPFARASAAVRAGVEAGYRRDGRGLAVDIYEIDDTPQRWPPPIAACSSAAPRSRSGR